jgi:hypothetical protein
LASASANHGNLSVPPWKVTGSLPHRILWSGSPLGHVVHAYCPYQGTHQPQAFPSLTASALLTPNCMPTTHTHTHTWLLTHIPHPSAHQKYPWPLPPIYQPLKGPNLVTLLPSPIGSPYLSDTASASWWVGFYIILHFCQPRALLAARLMPDSCLSYSSTLKMEVTCSSKTLVVFRRMAWHYIPQDRTLHNHCCENLRSYAVIFYFINPRQRTIN